MYLLLLLPTYVCSIISYIRMYSALLFDNAFCVHLSNAYYFIIKPGFMYIHFLTFLCSTYTYMCTKFVIEPVLLIVFDRSQYVDIIRILCTFVLFYGYTCLIV